MKRWGKSPPASLVTARARQTPPGARPNRRALEGGPPKPSGRSLELGGNVRPRVMVAGQGGVT